MANKNMLGALREWERALGDDTLTQEQRKTILYNCVCVHAGMGDLELAQVRSQGHRVFVTAGTMSAPFLDAPAVLYAHGVACRYHCVKRWRWGWTLRQPSAAQGRA